ncbi:ketosynthase chain-length factor [Kitasatospora sp. NBC_00315]|uniref:ketosynthase chain-length factor n=1 Tax=Kitasatospora sp. NBC_00315 TaxID=2975963 RepID=UPI003255353F
MSRQAVVTGLGVIAPTGVGVADYWAATLRGRSGIRRLERFDPSSYPSVLAGEIPEDAFDAADHLPSRLLPQTDRMTRMALAAADWALADAGADPARTADFDMGVVTASSSGGYEFGQRELQNLWGKGPEHVSAYQSFAWFYAVNTGQISIRNGMRGPSAAFVAEQAGGLDVLGQARRSVRKGTPMMLSGGVDGSLCPWGWVAHLSTGLVSTEHAPERAYLPFAQDAGGHVPGEGGALLLVEDAEAFERRGGAGHYGTIAGYAATFDPRPGSGRPPALRRAAELALADAGLTAAEVDVVFADAAGSPEQDRAEAEAIRGLFGARAVPVAAPKASTGRLGSGGAPLDVVAALLSMRDGLVPPAGPVTAAAEAYGLDLVVGEPRRAELRTALVLARGHGGFNSALVLRAPAAEGAPAAA